MENHGKEDGDGEHNEGQGVDETPANEIGEDDEHHDHPGREIESRDPPGDFERYPGDGQEMTENSGSGNDDQDHAGDPGRFPKGGDESSPVYLFSKNRYGKGGKGTHRPGFRGGEKPHEKSAHDDDEKEQGFPEA